MIFIIVLIVGVIASILAGYFLGQRNARSQAAADMKRVMVIVRRGNDEIDAIKRAAMKALQHRPKDGSRASIDFEDLRELVVGPILDRIIKALEDNPAKGDS